MPVNPTYSGGTIAVSAGSAVVTGTGTLWVAEGIEPGDVLERNGLSVTVQSIESNTQLTLVKPWPGTTGSGVYELRYTPDATRVLTNSRAAIAMFEARGQEIQTAVDTFGALARESVSALMSDTSLAYGVSAAQVQVANHIRTKAEGFSYRVAPSDATDHHMTTAGGVRLYVLPIGEDYYVDAFGAVGNGSTDDTVAINKAADAVRAAGRSFGIVFDKPRYRVSALINLVRIRRICMIGELQTTISTGVAVRIGTDQNANVDMEGADVQVFVRSTQVDNSAMAGSIGIEVKGSARGSYRLYSYGFEYGINLNAQGASATGYLAFNNFVLGTNRCRVGLRFDQQGATAAQGWMNENTFIRADLYPQGNALPGETIGILFDGATGYASNNNKFLTCCVEHQQVPVWIQSGFVNVFRNVRMESAGAVRFGVNGAGNVQGNIVEIVYPGHAKSRAGVDWQCRRPNLVYFQNPAWVTEFAGGFDDFITVAGQVHSTRFINTATGTGYFEFATLDAADRTFTPGSNHNAATLIRVQRGDVLRLSYGKAGDDIPQFSVVALGAGQAGLPSLASGSTPYIGSDATTSTAGESGTASFISFNNAAWHLPVLLSINRDDVQWIRVNLTASGPHRYLRVERLQNKDQASWGAADRSQYVAGIVSVATPPRNAGQIGVISSTRAAVATASGTWLQLNQFPTATTADMQSAASALNTANKVAGVGVRDATSKRLFIADGNAAAAPWISSDGTVTITPS